MQRLLNNPKNYVDEMLSGFYTAHKDTVRYINDDLRCLVSVHKKKGKVGLATGGGSGHLPLFIGYVGDGLLDGCAIGGVFQSPSSMQMLNVTKEIDSGAGVVYIYGNYGGDVMNFDMAQELAESEGINVNQVVVGEDVASAPKGMEDKRRGVAGLYFVYKIAGAAANHMLALPEVTRIAQKTADNIRTIGVALSSCIIPEIGKPNFSIDEGTMEIGMGIHGEPGIDNGDIKPADEVVEYMFMRILEDFPCESNTEVAILVNGLGATPLEELYIAYRKVYEIALQNKLLISSTDIGNYVTSMDMAGFSISVLKLDDELKQYLNEPCQAPLICKS